MNHGSVPGVPGERLDMHLREVVRHEETSPIWSADGLVRAMVIAVSALSGCALLIIFGTVVSVSWTVHPLLAVPASLVGLWIAARLAGVILCTGPPRG
ncbi:MAG: hypothetical protein QG622_3039 [Actinomycetota bacterium]|nr:hypothetical protein [Actinomycetota bacterium]